MKYSFLVFLCFAVFGLVAVHNPFDRFNAFNLTVGVITGICFGIVYRFMLSFILGITNRKLKQKHGRKEVKKAIARGMTFLLPFALMSLVAAYLLHWTALAGFVSAAFMTASVAAAVELGKLKGKQEAKDALFASVTASLLGIAWNFSLNFVGKIPLYLEGAVHLLKTGINLFR
ncbi:hypothetical protein Calow_2191 [Caldicellulosiruptor owensensis OL]|uniref:Uncharacterized protein n=1 Tax=Caldicellulosiruptor owensensis (strain ATCC 700167 / DSM 13100 / OL) TaxID=632518 RepID=E4Q717_CALOW|nr:hypothetical protein [Caldicellulosiruptor owensensis]ADQ05697.1 hypothetical protein Calow_2191 [Caldicellulosiruptor owensensis OL]